MVLDVEKIQYRENFGWNYPMIDNTARAPKNLKAKIVPNCNFLWLFSVIKLMILQKCCFDLFHHGVNRQCFHFFKNRVLKLNSLFSFLLKNGREKISWECIIFGFLEKISIKKILELLFVKFPYVEMHSLGIFFFASMGTLISLKRRNK